MIIKVRVTAILSFVRDLFDVSLLLLFEIKIKFCNGYNWTFFSGPLFYHLWKMLMKFWGITNLFIVMRWGR